MASAAVEGRAQPQVASVRAQLMSSLRQQSEKETMSSVARIQEAVAPHKRRVRSERTRLTEALDALEGSAGEIRRLEFEIRGS